MNKLFLLIGTTIGGYAGWYLGEAIGWEILGCFILSGVGSIAGIVGGWWLARRML